VLAHHPAELERHPVDVGELQVGDAVADLGGELRGLRVALPVELRQPHEAGAPARRDLARGIIGAEEPVLAVVVERDQAGHPPRHLGVAGQRPVLGFRQFQAGSELYKRRRQRGRAERVKGDCRGGRIHPHKG
jgi:hypothetical protein